VPDAELPVLLPDRVELTGEASPLARHPDFASVPCPRCGAAARRESDTMDTFVDSAWYFFRYLDPHAERAPFGSDAVADWMPIDLYVGGNEHAVTHLIYSRWWARAMRLIGLPVPAEPITRLIHHGMVTLATLRCPEHGWLYPDQAEDGRCRECGALVIVGDAVKMSKSKRNVIEPDEYVRRYGADTLRLFSLFTAPPGKELEWSDAAVEGMSRFLARVHRLAVRPGLAETDAAAPATTPAGDELEDLLHRAIHRVTVDVDERLHLNTGIAAVMELVNAIHAFAPIEEPLPADAGPVRRAVEGVLLLLAPYAPHLAEEGWAALGHETLVADAAWPQADPARLVADRVTVAVQVNGKRRGEIEVARDADEAAAVAEARGVEAVARHLEGMQVVKVVHVPNRLLNFVVRPS
jgi:leucyl-tRNA synthetase